jgi:uncharacterized protein
VELDEQGFALFADPALRAEVSGRLKELGFTYAAIDLEGYRTGSMNATLSPAGVSPPLLMPIPE